MALGHDDDGEPVTSCVIAPDGAVLNEGPRITRNDMSAINSYQRACKQGQGLLDAEAGFIGLHVEDWRAAFYETCTADDKKKAFQRARSGLNSKGLLSVRDDVYRVIYQFTTMLEPQFIEASRAGQNGTFQDIPGHCPA